MLNRVLSPSVPSRTRYGESFVFTQHHVIADHSLQCVCLESFSTCSQSVRLLNTRTGSTAITNWGNTGSHRNSGYSFVTLLIIKNHNVHHHIHNSPPLVSTLNQINPVHPYTYFQSLLDRSSLFYNTRCFKYDRD